MPQEAMELDPFLLLDEALALDKENAAPTRAQHQSVTYLPDGDIHVCNGPLCPFVELNLDKCYVCTVSGIVFGAMSVRDDFSTGRQAGSSNPDDHAGEPLGGQWRPKKDLAGMSNAAMNAAATLEDEQLCAGGDKSGTQWASPPKATPPESPRVAKRGARCVTEDEAPANAAPKRARAPRERASDRERFRTLSEDAEATLSKLVNFEKRSEAKSAKPRDARLMDRAALFELSLKKYCKECLASGTAPSLDDIHNISLAAARIAVEEKRKASLEGGRKAPLLKVRIREQVSSLAVSLWQASCKTPYMASARKGADSFRPFVCGAFYALKRGVSLPDGTVVMPACPELAEALPALRSTAAGSAAKALHASSHRGLCTLHRSISSCTPEQASELYGDCARLASQLIGCVRSGNYDLC